MKESLTTPMIATTTTTLLLGAVLALVIGAVLGMLGGGGAILTLPMLVYVLKVEPRGAIATSLVVVGLTSLVGTTIHARRKSVDWKVGLVFGAAAMVASYGAGRMAYLVPVRGLLVLFALIMLVTAGAMLLKKTPRGGAEPALAKRQLDVARMLALGAAVGVLSGLVGAGGGFLIVPALVLFGGIAMREAIGTSLFVITLQSFAGFAGQAAKAGAGDLDITLILVVSAAAVAGSIAGAVLGKRVSTDALRGAFAWLVLGMGLFMIGKQLPIWAALAVAVVVVGAIGALLLRRHGRLHRHTEHGAS